MIKNAIVIGATSGIGKELAKILSQHGYIVGLAGRRTHLLDELRNELSNNSFAKHIDISQTDKAIKQLEELIAEMGGADVIVISSGVGYLNKDLQMVPGKRNH